jgi:hypothetical protein
VSVNNDRVILGGQAVTVAKGELTGHAVEGGA